MVRLFHNLSPRIYIDCMYYHPYCHNENIPMLKIIINQGSMARLQWAVGHKIQGLRKVMNVFADLASA